MSRLKPKAQDQLAQLLREEKRKKFRRWILAGALLSPIFIAGSLFAWNLLTFDHASLPQEVYRYGDLDQLRRLRQGRVLVPVDSEDPFALPIDSVTIASTELLEPPMDLVLAAKGWVDTQNRNTYGLFIEHRVDVYGNLYLYPGFWWYQLTPEQQTDAAEELGLHWRTYLSNVFEIQDLLNAGGRHQFQPGVILFDSEGEVARSLDGYTRLLRESKP